MFWDRRNCDSHRKRWLQVGKMKLQPVINRILVFDYWAIMLALLQSAHAGDKCSISVTKPCKNDNESCYQISKSSDEGVCGCVKNTSYVNKACIPNDYSTTVLPQEVTNKVDFSSESFSGTMWVLIPCLSLATVGLLLLLGKRYRVTERLYALRVRRYNTVFVSSANVDDDAPIT